MHCNFNSDELNSPECPAQVCRNKAKGVPYSCVVLQTTQAYKHSNLNIQARCDMVNHLHKMLCTLHKFESLKAMLASKIPLLEGQRTHTFGMFIVLCYLLLISNACSSYMQS